MSRLDVANAFAKSYTPPNERAVRMARMYAEEGMTLEEIAGEFGITRQRVDQILKPFGIKPHYGRRKREERARLLREAHGQILGGHETMKEVAERLNYSSADSLWHALTEQGLALPPRRAAQHGTMTMYASPHNCRCPECRRAQREVMRQRRERGPTTHGSASSYSNYGCRCPECKEAVRLYRRDYLARKRQEKSPTD